MPRTRIGLESTKPGSLKPRDPGPPCWSMKLAVALKSANKLINSPIVWPVERTRSSGFEAGNSRLILAVSWTPYAWVSRTPAQRVKHSNQLQAPNGRVHFANSDLSSGWAGWIDGAIESALQSNRNVQRTSRHRRGPALFQRIESGHNVSTIQEQYQDELNARLAEWKSGTLEPPFRFADMRTLLAITVALPVVALIVGWFL